MSQANTVGRAMAVMHLVLKQSCKHRTSYIFALGKTKDKRLENYRQLFKAHVGVELLKEIRASVNKGLALGNERFANQIEALTEKRVTTRKPGRPKMELVDEDKN